MARLYVHMESIFSYISTNNMDLSLLLSVPVLLNLSDIDGIVFPFDIKYLTNNTYLNHIQTVQSIFKSKMSYSMIPSVENVNAVRKLEPYSVYFVSDEKPEQNYAVSSIDISKQKDYLYKLTSLFKETDTAVNILLEPDLESIKIAHKIDFDFVCVNIAKYTNSVTPQDRFTLYNQINNALKLADKLNMSPGVFGGVASNNIQEFISNKEISQIHVGFSLFEKSILLGVSKAVSNLKDLLK